jgi:SAM-dependent methyltransferase
VDDDVARRYNRVAGTYSTRYADPKAVAAYFVGLVATWGAAVPPGSTVLEVGCADGFITEALSLAGYRVTAVDVAPEMVRVARERLAARGLEADVRVGDVGSFDADGSWDVLLGTMRTFYAYVDDPSSALARLAPSITVKAIVDLNPRTHAIDDARKDLLAAGFDATRWRPASIPTRYRVGRAGRAALELALRIPPVRDAVLRRKLNVVVLGERR